MIRLPDHFLIKHRVGRRLVEDSERKYLLEDLGDPRHQTIGKVESYVLMHGECSQSETLCCLGKRGLVAIISGHEISIFDVKASKRIQLARPSKDRIISAYFGGGLLITGSEAGAVEALELDDDLFSTYKLLLKLKHPKRITSVVVRRVNNHGGVPGYCAGVGVEDGTLMYLMFRIKEGIIALGERHVLPLVKNYLTQDCGHGKINGLTVSQDGTVTHWELGIDPKEEDKYSIIGLFAHKMREVRTSGLIFDGMTGSSTEHKEPERRALNKNTGVQLETVLTDCSPLADQVLTVVNNDKLRRFIIHGAEEVLQIGEGHITAIAMNDKKALVGTEKSVRLYDFDRKYLAYRLFEFDDEVTHLALSKDGNYAGIATSRELYLCELKNLEKPLKQLLPLPAPVIPLTTLQMTADGKHILTGDDYGRVVLHVFKG